MAHRAGFSGRRKVVIAAWKTYLDSAQSEALAAGIRNWAAGRPDARYELLLSPTALHAVLVGRAAGKTAAICAQDLDPVGRGAYTGQVPPQLLTDAGCSHVLLGHSEARRHGGDTDHTLGRKVEAALDNSDLHAILCIGESREQRDGGFTLDTLESQLRGALGGVSRDSADGRIDIAYEPVWAISSEGPAEPPEPHGVDEIHCRIRDTLEDMLGSDAGQKAGILYGGSVSAANVAGYLGEPNIDGVLVGSASTTLAGLTGLLEEAERILET